MGPASPGHGAAGPGSHSGVVALRTSTPGKQPKDGVGCGGHTAVPGGGTRLPHTKSFPAEHPHTAPLGATSWVPRGTNSGPLCWPPRTCLAIVTGLCWNLREGRGGHQGPWLSPASRAVPWGRVAAWGRGQVEGRARCVEEVLTHLGCALQVAQMASALCWVVEALRGSGLGSEEGAPTLGEWVAVLP